MLLKIHCHAIRWGIILLKLRNVRLFFFCERNVCKCRHINIFTTEINFFGLKRRENLDLSLFISCFSIIFLVHPSWGHFWLYVEPELKWSFTTLSQEAVGDLCLWSTFLRTCVYTVSCLKIQPSLKWGPTFTIFPAVCKAGTWRQWRWPGAGFLFHNKVSRKCCRHCLAVRPSPISPGHITPVLIIGQKLCRLQSDTWCCGNLKSDPSAAVKGTFLSTGE